MPDTEECKKSAKSLKSLKSLMQIFVESAESAKPIFATFARANLGKRHSDIATQKNYCSTKTINR